MSNAAAEVLEASAAEVLETMFFTEVGEEAAAPPAEEAWVSAGLEFRGEPGGRLRVGVSDAAARTLAASFLGLEEDAVSRSQVSDVVCELANMICGSVVSRLESSAPIALLHPEPVDGAPPAGARILTIEGGRLAVWLDLEAAGDE